MHACVNVDGCGYTCMKRDVYNCVLVCWGQRLRLSVCLDHFHLIYWGRIFVWTKNLPIWILWLTGLLQGFQFCLPSPGISGRPPCALSICVGAGDPNSGFHVHPESALPAAETSLHPWGVFFFVCVCTVCTYACVCKVLGTSLDISNRNTCQEYKTDNVWG